MKTTCIEWQKARNAFKYGVVWNGQKVVLAHRHAWAMANGPIPDGLHVCHHCDNPPCINVDHLFLGTAADNARDKQAKGRARGGGGKPKKLDWEKVESIRRETGPYKAIALKYGVDPSLISKIRLGTSWKVKENGDRS